ncbi:hypothetical protein L1049_005145 [Liquidambar formosana]|uniref:Uncharacterized protein n=1 Tax=Liquidambar formosana TaxID=63359 RepID=A0AAP0RPN9_LIQFO
MNKKVFPEVYGVAHGAVSYDILNFFLSRFISNIRWCPVGTFLSGLVWSNRTCSKARPHIQRRYRAYARNSKTIHFTQNHEKDWKDGAKAVLLPLKEAVIGVTRASFLLPFLLTCKGPDIICSSFGKRVVSSKKDSPFRTLGGSVRRMENLKLSLYKRSFHGSEQCFTVIQVMDFYLDGGDVISKCRSLDGSDESAVGEENGTAVEGMAIEAVEGMVIEAVEVAGAGRGRGRGRWWRQRWWRRWRWRRRRWRVKALGGVVDSEFWKFVDYAKEQRNGSNGLVKTLKVFVIRCFAEMKEKREKQRQRGNAGFNGWPNLGYWLPTKRL